ncbi:hypothetical protein [Urbifossiella limnaea]|uniref:YbgF trimerisation domain-containing protein n=1 Tax=Urbifossiella limnaea TaxID=2528023 RepID=A0A517XKZ0_9BACT|nr:hypothetical protein [Urbifossiella limnaea]QDU18177.1 hypothetical protein ETAA1_00600 [Urbifossiella limnaea]
MRARLLIVPLLFAAAAGAAHTQPPSSPPAVVSLPPVPPSAPALAPSVPQPLLVGAAEEKSLERMLDQLEGLRARKADLEKQEQELMKDIRKLLDRQDERVKRLGVVAAPPVVPAPPPSVPAAPPLVVPSGAGLPPFPLPKKS